MRTLSMSTASSDIERSQDRELPLMKLYSSKKTPLAFMAPWLTVDGKPEMTFPPPEEPHSSLSVDSVRRLSILSSLNMPNQKGTDLDVSGVPGLNRGSLDHSFSSLCAGAEGPKAAPPRRVGFLRRILDMILWRSDKKPPKRKHEEVEEVKRFAGTPAPKERRVSSETPTTAATVPASGWREESATSVEEMQDSQDEQDLENREAFVEVEEKIVVAEEGDGGVEEMQDEQDLETSSAEGLDKSSERSRGNRKRQEEQGVGEYSASDEFEDENGAC